MNTSTSLEDRVLPGYGNVPFVAIHEALVAIGCKGRARRGKLDQYAVRSRFRAGPVAPVTRTERH